MLTFNAITHTCNMGRNQTKTCKVCFKAMRGDVLQQHIKKHERGNYNNVIINRKGTTLDNVKSVNYEELKHRIAAHMEYINRKIEMGQMVRQIVDEDGYNEKLLPKEEKEALDTYQLHGKNIDMEDIEWRGWQRDLRQYLDKPCDRKVIWDVGKEGNEGK